jgi:putative hydrolase of HD superfamily
MTNDLRQTPELDFLVQVDRLKEVVRQSKIASGARRENSAEHSWHLAIFALVFSDQANEKVDVGRVVELLLVHDIVEIDAGDMPIHGVDVDLSAKARAEQRAAERIFGLLPSKAETRFRELWREFEEGQTSEAKFARALDRFQPLLLNVVAGGGTWSDNKVSQSQVIERYGPTIDTGSSSLWTIAQALISSHFVHPPDDTRG